MDEDRGAGGSGSELLLGRALTDRVREAAHDVAGRLRDPGPMAWIVGRPSNVEPVYGSSVWGPGTLSHGLAGTALMFSLLSEDDPASARAAEQHLRLAAQHIEWNSRGGLMGGPAAVLAAAQGAVGGGERYGTLRRQLGEWVGQAQIGHLERYERATAPGVHWHQYDLVNGLSGTMRVLLDEPSETARRAVERSARYLCGEILGFHGELPGWWVPAHLQPTPQDREEYPHGDLNLGLAHGVAGVVACLVSVAEERGPTAGIAHALERAVAWILEWTQRSDGTAYWPARVPADCASRPSEAPALFTRAAWCYGTPGVALTLLRAARLLGDEAAGRHAVEVLLSHLALPLDEWHLDGSTFCHGSAGTLQVVYRMWRLTGDERLREPARRLAEGLVGDLLSHSAPYGFQHWMPDSPHGWRDATGHRRLDAVGLLEGASGVVCVLDSVSRAREDPLPRWDRVFGLS